MLNNNNNKKENTMQKKQIRKIIKVLAKKAKGLSRLEKVKEMSFGLSLLNLMVLREKRDRGISSFSYETLDEVDKILENAKSKRQEIISASYKIKFI